MAYLARTMERCIKEGLKNHPVVILSGPRQVGKSTLLKNASFLKTWKYITFDDDDALAQGKEDPKGLLAEERPTVLDEVQRHEKILLTVKFLVDQSSGKRKFILSGSGNIPLRKGPRETLAGRARYYHLTPVSVSELKHRPVGVMATILAGKEVKSRKFSLTNDPIEATWRGGLPRIALTRSQKACLEILASYVDTYLKRDIQDLVKIRHPENFRKLMVELAKNTGWESLQEQLSQVCGEERSNVSRYLSVLNETGLLQKVTGYVTKGENVYRHAKYYWFDSGVACFLSGIHRPQALRHEGIKGRYFENFILQQILYHNSLQVIAPEVFYWKPKREGQEVDFVIKQAETLIPIEVKSTPNPSFRHTESLRKFLSIHPEAHQGLLVYTGDRLFHIASNIIAVPWQYF